MPGVEQWHLAVILNEKENAISGIYMVVTSLEVTLTQIYARLSSDFLLLALFHTQDQVCAMIRSRQYL